MTVERSQVDVRDADHPNDLGTRTMRELGRLRAAHDELCAGVSSVEPGSGAGALGGRRQELQGQIEVLALCIELQQSQTRTLAVLDRFLAAPAVEPDL